MELTTGMQINLQYGFAELAQFADQFGDRISESARFADRFAEGFIVHIEFFFLTLIPLHILDPVVYFP